ncbi:MAG: carbamoyl phosphate synthase small subunit [Clostridia bacterium]|nr:carbamoyl phosphate synthase small subunit [Clostridia bacterium]
MSTQKAYLVLEDGTKYEGKFFGHIEEVTGEVVFSTNMIGYIETLTDPGYKGQIIVQTFPLIGNYGIISEDFESAGIGASAYIVKEVCDAPSNFRCEGDIDTFLKEKKITALAGIDTRALTMKIRTAGTMNGIITSNPDSVDLEKVKSYKISDVVPTVSTKEAYKEGADGDKNIAVLDLGVKASLKKTLISRGCNLTVYPYNTSADEILALNPDGIIVSDGPGDPTELIGVIAEVKKLLASNIPMLGIGLGHQVMALASGLKVEKMHHGHRGANQPCKDSVTGKVFITSQNHGYAVVSDSVNSDIAEIMFANINDNSCEGLSYKKANAISVQFSADSCRAPLEGQPVYDRFFELMK